MFTVDFDGLVDTRPAVYANADRLKFFVQGKTFFLLIPFEFLNQRWS
jgi:hypothetical protein